MGQDYEVQFANPLEGTDNYGNITYSVKFTTESDSALWKVQPKTVVQPGTKVFGKIEQLTGKSGKTYRKFTRVQQDGGNFTQTRSSSAQATGGYSKGSNNDGMRQGMCINNATAYVNVSLTDALSAKDWAKKVYDYANELYALGDLGQKPQETVVSVEEVDNATDQSILADIKQLGF